MAEPRNTGRNLILLAYQSFRLVFAELAISPIYAYKVICSGRLQHYNIEDVTFGSFSVIFWALTLVSLLKYAIIMLSFEDHGEGGIFALYSVLCRHAKLGLFLNYQTVDEELTTYYDPRYPVRNAHTQSKRQLKKRKTILLIMSLFGSSLVVCIGVLKPSITVLSSIEGAQVRLKHLPERFISSAILVGLFVMQHRGTYKAAVMFAPIMILWSLLIAALGVYNVLYWNPNIYRALSPYHVYNFFRHTGKDGFVSLTGILLCVAGSEVMFAYIGRFSVPAIRISFLSITYPCLVLQYMGQAAFLSKNFSKWRTSFYASIPEALFWPVCVMAILAAIISGQAAIYGACSIIRQSHALGCFPRIKVLHTSRWVEGQIYIPELNWILLLLCLAVTVGFRNIKYIAYAYGFACMGHSLVMTWLTCLVIQLVQNKSLIFAAFFFLLFGAIDLTFLFASCLKIPKGGWTSLLISTVFTLVMYVWHYATRKKFQYDLHNKVPMKWVLTLGPSLGVVRVPGIGIFYTALATGIPSTFTHFLDNLPVFYQVAVFVCVKTVPVPYVPFKERYLIGRIGPKSYRVYRCIVRKGYKDVHSKEDDFENDLIMCLAEFIQLESEGGSGSGSGSGMKPNQSMDCLMALVGASDKFGKRLEEVSGGSTNNHVAGPGKGGAVEKLQHMYAEDYSSLRLMRRRTVQFRVQPTNPQVEEELSQIVEAKQAGITYVVGLPNIKAKMHSSYLKKFLINVAYSFLRKNCRDPAVVLNIPEVCLIQVGMNYYV